MSDKTLDLAVMLGRFRIFHNGHKSVIDLALTKANRVLIGVGSANKSRDTDGNEFTAVEAAAMIREVYPLDTTDGARISIRLIDDVLYDEMDLFWIMGVQRTVAEEVAYMRKINLIGEKAYVGLIGFSKDSTSYYLKKFPQWSSIAAPGFKQNGKIVSATDIRKDFFYSDVHADNLMHLLDRVPMGVFKYMAHWAATNAQTMQSLREERNFLASYKEDHQFRGKLDAEGRPLGIKYKPTHTTVDAILIQSGHVLLIKRKLNPGKGKWALPGGFVEEHENITTATTRELKEETKIALSLNVLQLAFRKRHVFAGVGRSGRGRIITHVSLYLLNDRDELPRVEGADDAEKAEWVPLGELDPTQMHDDHWHLIMKMIGSMIGD
jgi:bifunctional NMN adenylyltransferase/nudix hydrolase